MKTKSVLSASSLKHRDEVVNYFATSTPDLECDFYMVIDFGIMPSSKIPVTDFSFPNVGVVYSSDSNMYGHLVPSFSTDKISVHYLMNENADVLKVLWENQFVDGVPKFIPISARPTVQIFRMRDNKCIFQGRHCMFSYPTPSISVSGTSAASYAVSISFEEFDLI